MDIITEVRNTFKIDEKKLINIQIMALYLTKQEDINCYQSIIDVYQNLNKGLELYQIHPDQKIINRLINDYDTYKELNLEFAEYVYPSFSPYLIILLNNQPESELELILDFLKKKNNCYDKNDVLNKIKECLTLAVEPDAQANMLNYLQEHQIDNVSIDQMIKFLRNRKKELLNKDFDQLYDELLGIYFDYLSRK